MTTIFTIILILAIFFGMYTLVFSAAKTYDDLDNILAYTALVMLVVVIGIYYAIIKIAPGSI